MSRQLTSKRRSGYDKTMVSPVVEMVKSGQLTIGQASRTYKIPKSTIHDRLKNKYSTDHIGISTVLTGPEEQRIVDWALHMSRIGYGRTRQELATTVKAILDDAGRTTKFKENKPGRQWFRGFFGRHPELTIRTTIQLGKERAIISKEKISKWFEDLQTYVNKEIKEPGLLEDPSRIYNADESGFSLCPSKGSKVVGSKGAPVVYHYGNSDKTQLTVMAAASATGHFIPPMIIFPGQRFSYEPLAGFEEAAFGRSESGWMDSEVFVMWLKEVFIPSVEARNVRKPVLLLIDGHSTHVSMEASNTCIANGIEMYCLLEHSSHIMQPLDLRFFASLKSAWRQSVRDYQAANIGEFVTKHTFARVFKQAWKASSTVDAAVKGFMEAGLFPLDVNRVVSSIKIQPSQVFTCTSSGDSCTDKPPANSVESRLDEDDKEEEPRAAVTANNPTEELHIAPAEDNAPQPIETEEAALATNIDQTENENASKKRSTSPFSTHLEIPAKIQQSKSKRARDPIPKAITGKNYRAYLTGIREKKAQKEREQELKRQERMAKKLQKEEENRRRKEQQQRKKKLREEKKRERVLKKQQKRAEEDRILKDIEASDSDDAVLEERGKCYACEKPYGDSFIQCTTCFRRFHVQCVEEDMLCGTEDIPFECKYC